MVSHMSTFFKLSLSKCCFFFLFFQVILASAIPFDQHKARDEDKEAPSQSQTDGCSGTGSIVVTQPTAGAAYAIGDTIHVEWTSSQISDKSFNIGFGTAPDGNHIIVRGKQ